MIKIYDPQELIRFYSRQDSESLRMRFCRFMNTETITKYANDVIHSENICSNAIVENGEIVAVIDSFFMTYTLGLRTVEIGLMVDKNHRNKGLGKKLFAETIKRAIPDYADIVRSHCMRSNCWMTKICIDHGMQIETFGTEIIATSLKK